MADYLEVLLCPDEGYIVGALAAVESARVTLLPTHRLRVHVIADYLSSDARRRLQNGISHSVDVEFYESPETLHVENQYNWFASPTLGRLWVELLPKKVDRVVYLDCDTIVQEHLGRLISSNLRGSVIGACYNLVSPDRSIQISNGVVSRPDFGSASPGHFNSGILVIDVDSWRAKAIGERARDIWKTYGCLFEAPDQDLLNYVFQGAWQPLSPVWNKSIQVDIGQNISGEWLSHPRGILHYTGPLKPWDPAFPAGPEKDAFQEHQKSELHIC